MCWFLVMAVDHLMSGGESDTQRTCQSTNRCRSSSTGSLLFPLSLLFLMLMVVILSSSLAAVMAVDIKEDGDGLLSLPPSLPTVTDTTMLTLSLQLNNFYVYFEGLDNIRLAAQSPFFKTRRAPYCRCVAFFGSFAFVQAAITGRSLLTSSDTTTQTPGLDHGLQ